MFNFYVKIKESFFVWNIINSFLDGVTFLCDISIALRKKILWKFNQIFSHADPSGGQKLSEDAQRRRNKRLNILFYSPCPTYPTNHGNRTRMCNLVKKFEEMGHQVHFVMIDNFIHDKSAFSAMQKQYTTVDIVPCKKLMVSLGVVPYDGWYKKGIGEYIHFLCKRYEIDLVLCSYVYQSKLLEFVPDHVLKVIDTHDIMGNRSEMLRQNQLPALQFSCSLAEEGAYLKRADLVIGITDKETEYFKKVSGRNAMMISHVEKPKFIKKHFTALDHIGIVASSNRFNLAMVQKFLDSITQAYQMTDSLPFMIHIVGGIKDVVTKKMFSSKFKIFKQPWVKMHGFVPNISDFYSQMDLIVSPMLSGTGINIKTVEAMAHGMPLLTTVHGGRGMSLGDKMHNHEDIDVLVKSLFAISTSPLPELKRLADLSKEEYLKFYEKNERNCQLLFEHPKLKSRIATDV